MRRARLRQIVRQFAQNGIKLLLQDPRNVHDLLSLEGLALLDRIDFDHMTVERTTYVQRDYRHVEADVVLRAPLRRPGKHGGWITIYLLIEHQSEPKALMILRLLDYVIQIYKGQTRAWEQRHGSVKKVRLHPVLPVVLYTGQRPWPKLGQLLDLVELGGELGTKIPTLDVLYLNLAKVPAQKLESAGGYFGWVLRLIQERSARPAEFRRLLGRVVAHLEAMPEAERARWLELLSYVQALAYHERAPREHQGLREQIEASVRSEDHQAEVKAMGKTIADELIAKGVAQGIVKGIARGRKQGHEEGREEGREVGRLEGREVGRREGQVQAKQDTLLRLLRQRFQQVPAEMVACIAGTTSLDQLDRWLERFATAGSLAELEIR